MKILKLLLILFLSNLTFAFQLTININQVPDYMGLSENIYITGSFNSWNPGDVNYLFTNNLNGTYSLTMDVNGTISFKFTKGDFLTVEKDENCQEIADRNLNVSSNTTINLSIENWRDHCEGNGQHTATSNVSILNSSFLIPQLNTTRRIWIYLPPDYDNSTKEYPVVYMHDGQNLFDAYYSFSGEWEVDESMNNLFNNGDYGAIIVGVDNGGSSRIDEYSPWINPDYGGGDGDLYMDFIVNTLKPYIDLNFRTKTERKYTAMIGSSLGGLISFYGGLEHQNIFSKLGIFSPSFWFSDEAYTFAQQTTVSHEMRMYFLAGSQESTSMVSDMQNMITTLVNSGHNSSQILDVVETDGQHAEWFWKREFPAAYQWLFLEDNLYIDVNQINFEIEQSESTISIKVDSEENFQLNIKDISGKVQISKKFQNYEILEVSNFNSGVYFLELDSKNGKILKKILIN